MEPKDLINFDPPAHETGGERLAFHIDQMQRLKEAGASPEELREFRQEYLEHKQFMDETGIPPWPPALSLHEQQQFLGTVDALASTPEGCETLIDAATQSPTGKINVYAQEPGKSTQVAGDDTLLWNNGTQDKFDQAQYMGTDGALHDMSDVQILAHELGGHIVPENSYDIEADAETIATVEQEAVRHENEIMSGFEGHVPRGDYDDVELNGTRGIERQTPDLKGDFQCSINPDLFQTAPEMEDLELIPMDDLDPALIDDGLAPLEEHLSPEQNPLAPEGIDFGFDPDDQSAVFAGDQTMILDAEGNNDLILPPHIIAEAQQAVTATTAGEGSAPALASSGLQNMGFQ